MKVACGSLQPIFFVVIILDVIDFDMCSPGIISSGECVTFDGFQSVRVSDLNLARNVVGSDSGSSDGSVISARIR